MRAASALSSLLVLGLVAAPPAMAKDAFNTTADLVGLKVLKSKIITSQPTLSATSLTSTGTKTLAKAPTSVTHAEKVEFVWLGQQDLWLVSDSGQLDVGVVGGLGSSHYRWVHFDGYTYDIPNYPFDNKHQVVSGTISKGSTVIGKFAISHIGEIGPDPAAGRWTGGLFFPGGKEIPVAMKLGGIPQKIFSGCSHGNLPVRIDLPGYGYAEGGFLRCDGDFFPNFPYYAQLLLWDETTNSTWFAVLEGFMTNDDQFFQGFVTLTPIIGKGEPLLGKFSVQRPMPFGSD